MRKRINSVIAGTLCGATAIGALPFEALAGPLSVASPSTVALSAPTSTVHYRRYHRGYRVGYYYPRRHYYRYRYPRYYRYGYDPAGAMFAGAALGIMGAGIAAATAPRWGWGYGGWGYGGWGWGPGWGWGGGWGPGWGWGWGGPGWWW
ncbi:hypothetical protein [Methylocystis sp. ATCC 49242]|uniref:hypothetical protein n=1 Tax=Methylocystis sp. ATCC 49242 TaxID=622637 RepID=UPI0001F87DFF|nr:hypothetical protein [Methylocystis sp. ATCC 49242]